MKRVVAVLFAAMIAAVLIIGLILIGVNAWVNPGSVPPSNSPAALDSIVAFLPATSLPRGPVIGPASQSELRSPGLGHSTQGKVAGRASISA